MDLSVSPEETKFFESQGAEVAESLQPPAPAPEPVAQPDPAPREDAPKEPVAADPPKPAPEAEPDPKLARQVPFSAVMEERGKRKAAQEELRVAQEELAKLKGSAPTPAKPAEGDGPDPMADIEWLKGREAAREQERQQATQLQAFQNEVVRQENEFVKENPDYPNVVKFLQETRTRQMREGLGLSDEQIHIELTREAFATSQYALQRGTNPAEIFTRLAASMGYKPKAADPVPMPAADVPNPDPPKPDPAAVARIETLRAGAKAGKTLSSGGGGAPDATITLESIANMDGAEFDNMWKNKTVRRLMGG